MKKYFFILLCVALLPLSVTAEQFQQWINATGNKMSAKLISVDQSGDGLVGNFLKKNGQKFTYPASKLSPEHGQRLDQFFKESQSENGPVFFEKERNNLVSLKGKKLNKFTSVANSKYYAIYFSAHWCPPCKIFTPKLVKFYKKNYGDGSLFEIIFVSSDKDEDHMREYMREEKMKWPAVKYDKIKQAKSFKKYASSYIPHLVIVDNAGNVIKSTMENGKYIGTGAVLQKLKEIVKESKKS